MKWLLVLCAIASLSAGAEWDAFKVTYARPGSKMGYYDMPWTTTEATAKGRWEKIAEDMKLNVDIYSQHNDPRVMLLFGKNGNIAGLRMSFLKDHVEAKAKEEGVPFEFDYDNNPLYEKGSYLGKDLWYTSVLFESPNKLAAGGRSGPLDKNTDSVAEALYFKPEGEEWVEVSREECNPTQHFVEANCYPGMGKHYFYKLDEPVCKQRKPFFALYNEGRLIGVGLSGFGSYTIDPKTQNYYEDFPLEASRSIIPNGPECIQEYIRSYGVTMMHVFLVKNAAKISCPPDEWRSTHC